MSYNLCNSGKTIQLILFTKQWAAVIISFLKSAYAPHSPDGAKDR